LIGTYALISGPTNTRYKNTLEIKSVGKNLYITSQMVKKPELLMFFHEEKPGFGITNSSKLLRFEQQG
jgi:hypothetical protein